MNKRSAFLKGKTFNALINMSAEEFSDIQKTGNEWKLRAVVTSMATTVNKRLAAFEKIGEDTPATNYITKRYGERISTADLSRNDLIGMYFELKGFGEAETSTVRGWNAVKNKVKERMSEEGVEIHDVDYKQYWDAFDEIQKVNKNRIERGVNGASEFDREMRYKILEFVREKLIKAPGRSAESIARSLFRKDRKGKSALQKIYEKTEADRRAVEDRLSVARVLRSR